MKSPKTKEEIETRIRHLSDFIDEYNYYKKLCEDSGSIPWNVRVHFYAKIREMSGQIGNVQNRLNKFTNKLKNIK